MEYSWDRAELQSEVVKLKGQEHAGAVKRHLGEVRVIGRAGSEAASKEGPNVSDVRTTILNNVARHLNRHLAIPVLVQSLPAHQILP